MEEEKGVKIGKYEIPRKANFPKPKPLLTLVGPAIIILGLSIGSGEIIIWPTIYSFAWFM